LGDDGTPEQWSRHQVERQLDVDIPRQLAAFDAAPQGSAAGQSWSLARKRTDGLSKTAPWLTTATSVRSAGTQRFRRQLRNGRT
jgi:hypothetical protein